MIMQWSGYGEITTSEGRVNSHRASIDSTPALDKMAVDLGDQWERLDRGYMAVYLVRYTASDGRESYEVGGVVCFRHKADGALLYVAVVSSIKGPQATPISAIHLSTAQINGVRAGEVLVGGPGLVARQREAANALLARHGHLLPATCWVQIPYQTRAGRNGRTAKTALRQWTVKELRQPERPALRPAFIRAMGQRGNGLGTWRNARAVVKATGKAGKVEVGRYVYTVRQNGDTIELIAPAGQVGWKFRATDFQRLAAKAPQVMGEEVSE